MGVPTFVFMICSLRTNVVYVTLFATILTGFCLLGGSFWHLAQENVETAHTLQIVSFASSLLSLAQCVDRANGTANSGRRICLLRHRLDRMVYFHLPHARICRVSHSTSNGRSQPSYPCSEGTAE